MLTYNDVRKSVTRYSLFCCCFYTKLITKYVCQISSQYEFSIRKKVGEAMVILPPESDYDVNTRLWK